jgi:MFS family permease
MGHYIRLLTQQPRFFLFSISSVFFSAPGQTFLISLFIHPICQALNISALQFAGTYSAATIMASFCLPIIGKRIDGWPLKRSLIMNTLSFSLGIGLFSISTSPIALGIALFLMRLFGQGVLTITATAATIKQFHTHRGSALSLTQLGYPLSEFIFPSVALYLASLWGWRPSFALFSGLILLLYFPLTWQWTCMSSTHSTSHATTALPSSSTLREVLKDKLFPVYLSLSAIPPVIMTGTFYFQVLIFSSKDWPITAIALAIGVYALTKSLATLIIGPIIDTYGVVWPLAILTACIGLATVLSGLNGPVYLSIMYYALYGIGIGCSASTMSFLWARLYGHKHIAQIKGAIAIARNGGTAITPITVAYLIYKLNMPLPIIFYVTGGVILCMATLPFILKKIDPRI